MENPAGNVLEIPAFTFRISEQDVKAYRSALGVSGDRVPFGMALRALSGEPVASRLRAMAAGKTPIHIAQEYRSERPLLAGVNYACAIRLERINDDRVRIEEELKDPSGDVCLSLASEIALVAS